MKMYHDYSQHAVEILFPIVLCVIRLVGVLAQSRFCSTAGIMTYISCAFQLTRHSFLAYFQKFICLKTKVFSLDRWNTCCCFSSNKPLCVNNFKWPPVVIDRKKSILYQIINKISLTKKSTISNTDTLWYAVMVSKLDSFFISST